MSTRILGSHSPQANKYPHLRAVLLRSREGFNPPDVPNIPLWVKDRGNPRQAVVDWETLVGSPVNMIDIPGNHFQPFHPSNVHVFRTRL